MRAAIIIAITALACTEADETPIAQPDVDAQPDAHLADGGLEPELDAEPEPDAAPDSAVRPPPPPLPRAEGPPADQFDCTAEWVDPGRLSPVPLDCVLDPDCAEPMVVGHRGAGGQLGTVAPENSLAAIRAALLLGVDGVELDVRHTADDRLVVLHDGTVDRTTFGTGEVSELTLAEATALSLRPLARDDIPGDFTCETVPSLEAAFALTRDRLFIDLDTKTSRVDLVVAAIQAAGLEDQVFVSVSSPERAARARAIDPAIRVQVRPDTPEEYAAAMALFDRPPEVVEVPADRLGDMAPAIRAAGQKVFTNVFGEDAVALLRGQLDAYLERYSDGADILQTEFPSLVVEALDR